MRLTALTEASPNKIRRKKGRGRSSTPTAHSGLMFKVDSHLLKHLTKKLQSKLDDKHKIMSNHALHGMVKAATDNFRNSLLSRKAMPWWHHLFDLFGIPEDHRTNLHHQLHTIAKDKVDPSFREEEDDNIKEGWRDILSHVVDMADPVKRHHHLQRMDTKANNERIAVLVINTMLEAGYKLQAQHHSKHTTEQPPKKKREGRIHGRHDETEDWLDDLGGQEAPEKTSDWLGKL